MKAQGIAEYTLILVLIAVVVIVVLALLGPAVGNILAGKTNQPCQWASASFECKNQRVEQCLKTEQYTKDQCVILIGGGK